MSTIFYETIQTNFSNIDATRMFRYNIDTIAYAEIRICLSKQVRRVQDTNV